MMMMMMMIEKLEECPRCDSNKHWVYDGQICRICDVTAEERARIDAAIAVFSKYGIDFSAPWECDLDDLEHERFVALCSALDAATAPLVAERERLRELLGQLVKGVDEKHLRIEGPIVAGLGTPDDLYVGWDWAAEWMHHARSALAEKEPG